STFMEVLFFQMEILFFRRQHFLLTKANCNFLKPAKLGDMIEIKTKILEVKNASVEILQEIYKDEILFFKMELTLAFIKNEKPARMDMQLKKLFEELF
ncbi:acyl-CoA thioesterase, partial [Campylobacter jejuni]|nr:acyl-CoA thioesterase [Campylobacter jejuni]